MCAVCGEYVDPHAPKFSDGQGEVDHVIPLRRLKQMYPDLVEYAAQANDPSNCRYVHRSPCHEDRGDPLLSRQPQRTRSSEWDDDLAGVDTGMANAHDLNEVVARLQAERDKPRPVHRISIG
jgi:5-methylcytosine-specific restriction endonuclease McrA